MGGTWAPSTLTILNGAQESEELLTILHGHGSISFMISAPAALPENVTIQVRIVTLWATLQSGGEDIVIPAGKATQVLQINCRAIRMKSSTAVAANRVFDLSTAMF